MLAVLVNQQQSFVAAKPGVGLDRELLEGFAALHRVTLTMVPVAGWDGLVPALQEGRGDVIAGRFTVTEARKKHIDFTVGVFLGPPGSLAWGVRKTDTRLREALDAYVSSVRRTPTWSRLVVKYFGEDAPEILKKARAEAAP